MPRALFILSMILLSQRSFCTAASLNDLLYNWDTTYINRPYPLQRAALTNIILQAKAGKNYSALSNGLRRLAILYKNAGKFDSCVYTVIESIHYADSAHDIISKASSCNQLGVLYYLHQQKQQALEYFMKAYALYSKAGYERGLSDVSGNISEVYSEMGSSPLVMHYAVEGLKQRKKWGDTTDIGYNYNWLARLYIDQKKFDTAYHVLHLAEAIFLKVKDSIGLVFVYSNYALWHEKQSDWKTARLYNQQAFDIAYRLDRKADLLPIAESLANTSERSGDTAAALSYLKIASVLRDSLLSESATKEIINAEKKYQGELKDLEINKGKQRILILVLSVILLFAFLILLWRNNQLARKKVQLREMQIHKLIQQEEINSINSMMKGQDSERQRIAQELHDRLGSMLATVKMHFGKMENEIAELRSKHELSYTVTNNLLDEACEEVRRISHDLYSGSLVRFGMKTALLQLINAIETANPVRIQFIDNNIPEELYKPFEVELYRITQELLSNSLKYAEATEIFIQLTQENNSFLRYSYEEDGKGFDAALLSASSGIGYRNIEHRIKKLNATWTLDTKPGHGLAFIAEIPLHG